MENCGGNKMVKLSYDMDAEKGSIQKEFPSCKDS